MTPIILFTYQYKDHTSTKLSTGLGNNRLSYADANGNGRIDTPATNGVTIWEDDFEDSVAGVDWNGSGNIYGGPITGFDQTTSYRGSRSGYVSIGEEVYGWQNMKCHSNEWVEIDIDKPTLFRYSAWVYASTELYRTRMYLFMKMEGETDYYSEISEKYEMQKGEWVYTEKVVLVSPEIKKLNLRIDADGWGQYGGTAWYDNLKIEQLDKDQNEIVSETNYYPFGLQHKGYNNVVNGTEYPYKYNGMEHQEELGLNWYDYGARMYDPAIGRWHVIDPLAELSRRYSPYTYALDNPIFFIDPDGMLAEPFGDFFDLKGNKVGTDGIDDGKKYVVTDKKEAKAIKKTDKKGGTTQVSDVSSAQQLPSDATLQESINVLDRTVDNGGKKEESSIVMNDGTVVKGQQGAEVQYGKDTHASAQLPNLPEGKTTADVEASIHSHPTKAEVVGDKVYGGNALEPTKADQKTFAQYGTNVIVGPLGQATATKGISKSTGRSEVNVNAPSNGVVIYKGSSTKPSLQLSPKAVKRIIKN